MTAPKGSRASRASAMPTFAAGPTDRRTDLRSKRAPSRPAVSRTGRVGLPLTRRCVRHEWRRGSDPTSASRRAAVPACKPPSASCATWTRRRARLGHRDRAEPVQRRARRRPAGRVRTWAANAVCGAFWIAGSGRCEAGQRRRHRGRTRRAAVACAGARAFARARAGRWCERGSGDPRSRAAGAAVAYRTGWRRDLVVAAARSESFSGWRGDRARRAAGARTRCDAAISCCRRQSADRSGTMTDVGLVLHKLQRLREQVTGVAGVRSRIAHGYASVDHARLWAELPAGLDALALFAVRGRAHTPGPPCSRTIQSQDHTPQTPSSRRRSNTGIRTAPCPCRRRTERRNSPRHWRTAVLRSSRRLGLPCSAIPRDRACCSRCRRHSRENRQRSRRPDDIHSWGALRRTCTPGR